MSDDLTDDPNAGIPIVQLGPENAAEVLALILGFMLQSEDGYRRALEAMLNALLKARDSAGSDAAKASLSEHAANMNYFINWIAFK
jgi:L-asparaginase II